MTVEQRFWAKVDKDGPPPTNRPHLGPCWLWTACTWIGYGQFTIKGKTHWSHRVSYELSVGPIPVGMDLDHLCRVLHCVNPAHLEPVSHQVNLLRGVGFPAENVIKTHCPQGHALTVGNLDAYQLRKGWRICRTCKNARMAAYRCRN